jgi:hypothetical protein
MQRVIRHLVDRFSLAGCALLMLSTSARGDEVTFRTDVMSVVSKAGCNAGACHGNGNGKGGFRLSLRGQDPDLDWVALTRDQGGRRINLLEPDKSLMILKPTGAVAHEGGKRFAPGSPEYEIVMRWLREGAPNSGRDGPSLVSLEVTPLEKVMVAPESDVTLHAVAHFSDGSARDVTHFAVYEANNLAATISPDGVVTRQAPGESTVLVRYLEKQVPVHLAWLPSRPNFVWSAPAPANFVDEHVFRKLQTLRMNPSRLCSDAVFVRRAYLDLLGIVPSAQAVRAFVAESTADKRARLVSRLLERDDFADFWALKWADLLKIEERVLDARGMRVFHGWIRESIAKNKPLDQFARELISARGSTYENPPANWWRANRDPITRGENTARVFFGTQLNCAQCHNHPFERWTQDDYYNWAALFARIDYKIIENNRRDKNDQQEFNGDQIVQFKARASLTNPRLGEPAVPRFLGGVVPQLDAEHDELQALAEWLSHSPMFARMQVNRIWFHLMGRGLVDPVDDFRATNPPSHPELLEALANEFVAHGYDLRHLIRTITASDTYQLESVPNDTNSDDDVNLSHAIVRRLTAEQLIDSMSRVLDAPLALEGFPAGTRLAQLPEGRKHYRPLKTSIDRFVAAFGKPPRLIASDCERSNETAMPQVFQLISGPIVQELLTRPCNRIDESIATGQSTEAIIEEMFVAALGRDATSEEVSHAAELASGARDLRRGLEDVMWALLNSKEFIFRR